MIGVLLRKASGSPRSDAWLVRIKHVEWLDRLSTADVRLSLLSNGRTEVWRLRAVGVFDALIDLAPTKSVFLTKRHIKIDQHVGPFVDLRFRGTPKDWGALVADLWNSHRSVAGDWLSVDDCFEGRIPFPQLLRSGRGFATGPARLLTRYASAMRRHGLHVALSTRHSARPFWSDGKWQARRPGVSFCSIGASYFVAKSFYAEIVE